MARYLSRAELSCIAGKYIEMYYALFGISKNDPAPINPEQFANSVLGLNLKMLPLCSDGHILGLTVFQRCSFTATLEDGTKLVEVFMPRDIVILHQILNTLDRILLLRQTDALDAGISQ